MIVLWLAAAVSILLVTHYSAFAYGTRRTDRLIWHRHLRPMIARHRKLTREAVKASLEANAPAQQRNVKLEFQNYRLRLKAIHYALKYRALARRARDPRSKAAFLTRILSEIVEVYASDRGR